MERDEKIIKLIKDNLPELLFCYTPADYYSHSCAFCLSDDEEGSIQHDDDCPGIELQQLLEERAARKPD